MVPFEVREGEHTPETDLIRLYQVLEEGDKFESSVLRLDRCLFSGSSESRHTLVSFID